MTTAYTWKEKQDALRKEQIRLERKAKWCRRVIGGVIFFSGVYFGGGALNGIGQRENERMAQEYGQVAPKQSYLENVADGLGHLAEDIRDCISKTF